MANNNSIQLLRTAEGRGDPRVNTETKDQILLDGQPLIDTANRWLFIGKANTKISELQTIHPDYSEEGLTESEVTDIWNNAVGASVVEELAVGGNE